MSLLYKDKKDVIISVEFYSDNDRTIDIEFTADCGKHSSEESIAGYRLTPERLLEILGKYKDYTDDEII